MNVEILVDPLPGVETNSYLVTWLPGYLDTWPPGYLVTLNATRTLQHRHVACAPFQLFC